VKRFKKNIIVINYDVNDILKTSTILFYSPADMASEDNNTIKVSPIQLIGLKW
jgi:hypothetical protein